MSCAGSRPSPRPLLVPNVGAALAAEQQRVTTPAQTEGPFYPTDWGGDVDNDLVRVIGEAAQAQGQITHILGRVLDTSGAPIPGAAIEIWQCDATGIYRHPRDTHWFRKRDGSFQGRGRATADAQGRLRVPHHQAGRLSGSHAAHPLRHHGAGARAADHANVRRRRSAERARRHPQRHPRHSASATALSSACSRATASSRRRSWAPSTSLSLADARAAAADTNQLRRLIYQCRCPSAKIACDGATVWGASRYANEIGFVLPFR